MRILTLGAALLLCAVQSFAQSDTIRCYSTEYNAALQLQYPELGTDEQFENWLLERAADFRESVGTRAVVTLPVVFHVIHNNQAVGTGDNVSALYINAQLQQINNDFRKILGTSGFNSNPVGADTELEFCMAQFNPQGLPMAEPGINRINTQAAGLQAPQYSISYMDNTVKPATQWNPNNYINIWVVRVGSFFGTILGYAQFPSQSGLPGLNANEGPANTDGVVIRPTTVGSTTTPNPVSGAFRFGRTLTHELGHFFGLRHIWGDGGCSVDDFCADTPASGSSTSGCPTGKVTCNTPDMIENYMDYTNDICMNIFTQCQKTRMQIVMANSPRRGSLVNSTACGSTQEPECTLPLPEPTGLQPALTPAGALLSWQPIPLTTYCKVQGGISPSGPLATFTVTGDEPSSYLVPYTLLEAGFTYRWRVRCGCSLNPLVEGPWSAFRVQFFPGPPPGISSDDIAQIEPELEKLFPNPSTGTLNIAYRNGAEPTAWRIFNSLGQVILSGMLPAVTGHSIETVEIGSMPPGVYFFQMEGKAAQKLIKH